MRYPLQFVSQGAIPRDPNLTVTMQRVVPVAEPVVTEAPAPPPLVTSLLLLANFDGTGDMSDYAADSGQSPILFDETVGVLSDYVLDGSGAVVNVLAAVCDGLVGFDVAPTTQAYKYETLNILDNSGGESGWSMQMDTVDADTGFYGVEFFVQSDGVGGFLARAFVYDDTFSPLYDNSDFPVDLIVGRPVLIGIEVTAAGTQFLLNDVLVASTPFRPDVIPSRCGFSARQDASTGIVETAKFYGVA